MDKSVGVNFQSPMKFINKLVSRVKMNLIKLNIKVKKLTNNKKFKKLLIGILVPILIFSTVLTVFVYDLYIKGKLVQKNLEGYSVAILESDFDKAESELIRSRDSLEQLESSYGRLSVFKYIPLLGNYYNDGAATLSSMYYILDAMDILTDSFGASTDNDIQNNQTNSFSQYLFLINSAPEIASNSAIIKNSISAAREKLKVIDPDDYPEKFFGKNVRLHIVDLLQAMDNSLFFLTKGDSLIEKLPGISGFNGERKYLVIFQNNKELRPTGGFITAYTIAKVTNGNFEIEDSSDIYELDDKYTPEIPAPKPIIDNLQGPYIEDENYRLRDMNWSPDFPTSMELFLNEVSNVGINDIDGVIAVDTQVLVDTIDVIGEINVPGYGGYSNNIVELCDCEQIIYELEHFADREGPIVWSENEPGKIVHAPENYDDRKKIIGPMMNTILGNVFNLRKTKYPALFNSVTKDIKEKHFLIYMFDESEQKAIEKIGAAGRLQEFKGDYILVNDSNLGGKKANLYVTHQVDQYVEIDDDGSVTKTVELTYRNPKPQNNWLNTVLPNYVRVYVPEGSEFIEFAGLDYADGPYDELGKTVFSGRLTVRPMGVTKVTLKYKLPFMVKDTYNLYVQKQPGKGSPTYNLDFAGEIVEFELDTDKEIIINLN